MLKLHRHIVVLSAILATSGQAADLSLSDVPIFLSANVAPNVMFTLDNSSLMRGERISNYRTGPTLMFPNDGRHSQYHAGTASFDKDNFYNFYWRSAANNPIFYNPTVTYAPWSNANGAPMANANPEAAIRDFAYNYDSPSDPYNPNIADADADARCNRADTSRYITHQCRRDKPTTIDLTTEQEGETVWYDVPDIEDVRRALTETKRYYWPITYFTYKGNGMDKEDRNSYTRTQITPNADTTEPKPSDGGGFPNPYGRTKQEEIQNFANWYQYYRSRILTAKAAVGRAFAAQGDNLRVGFSTMGYSFPGRYSNNPRVDKPLDGIPGNGVILGVRSFAHGSPG